MLILIEKDSSTRVPKECTPEQAQAFSADFPVHVVGDDGVTTPYAEWKESQGDAPVDDQAKAAEEAAFTKSGLTAAAWKKLAKAKRDALIQAELV